MSDQLVDAIITPTEHLNLLSQLEVNKLLDTSKGGLYNLFRRCALAVLSHGNYTDDAKELLERHKQFDIRIIQLQTELKKYTLKFTLICMRTHYISVAWARPPTPSPSVTLTVTVTLDLDLDSYTAGAIFGHFGNRTVTVTQCEVSWRTCNCLPQVV